jgi:hypothetical protein
MPRLRPFTPIFTKDLKYGTQARPGILLGSLNGTASPGAINVTITLPQATAIGIPVSGSIVESLIFDGTSSTSAMTFIDDPTVLFCLCDQTDHRVVNISDPLNLSVYATVTRSGEQVWVQALPGDIVAWPIGTNDATAGIRTTSLVTPGSPSTLQSFLDNDYDPQTQMLAYDGTSIAIENGNTGSHRLVYINVSNPSSMSTIDDSDFHFDINSPAFDGRYCYAPSAVADALYVFDFDDFANPVQIGVETGMNNCSSAVMACAPGETPDYVFVSFNTVGESDTGVIDVTTKSAPNLVTTVTNIGYPLAFINGTLITANSTTISFYDATALPTLTFISSFAHGLGTFAISNSGSLWNGGTYVYLPMSPAGVAVMELNF